MSTQTSPIGRVAIVTGANKGIGKEVARQLAQAGLTVLLGSRDEARGKAAVEELAATGLDVRLLQLDVTDATSIAEAHDRVVNELGRLDVLVNNAAYSGGINKPSEVKIDTMRRVLETNVLGYVAVTNAFLPLLRQSPAPRIVNVSSNWGSFADITDPNYVDSPDFFWAFPYTVSKTAINALTVHYANELRHTNIKVNVVNPGLRDTDIAGVPMQGAGDPAGGAIEIVEMALLPDDGPTGTFDNDDGTTHPW
jgi:NAD(P)-dependent dehydrogenase (short-subunit alcohol dehydrogenase family)